MALQLPSIKRSFFTVPNFSVPSSRWHNVLLASAYNPSRRLALLQLSTALSQSQLFDGKVQKLERAEESEAQSYTIANVSDPNDSLTSDDLPEWTKKDKRRLLHAVYRVGNLDKTIKFYTECLGMKVLRKRDIPEEKYSNAFLGFGSEESHCSLELTYNYGVDKYSIGTGFGHFGIAVENRNLLQEEVPHFLLNRYFRPLIIAQHTVAKAVDLVKSKGGKVTQEPRPSRSGNTRIAIIKDPDGYEFELLQKAPTPEPLSQVMLRVGDIGRSINFYRKAVGMELLGKKDYPDDKYTVAIMGFGPEDKNTVLELTYNYGVKEYDKGDGYAQIAIGTDDVYKSAEAIKLCGGKVIREPGPLPGINTKIAVFLDPDGWRMAFVDNIDFLKELK